MAESIASMQAATSFSEYTELFAKREIICLHLGQAGVQLGNAAWELFCIEHGIQADGKMKEQIQVRNKMGFTTFFDDVRGRQFVPRCLSVDLEPTVLDEVRVGPYRELFHPNQLISGYEDAANNFARGHYTTGRLYINKTLERLRKLCDNCENLQGFMIINSFGGGTGSGFTGLLISKLGVEYAKRAKFQIAIYPGTQLSTSVVEPYNTLMAVRSTKELTDVSVLMDNESLYDICGLSLDISKPTFNNLNRIIAQVFSSFTVSLRFENSLNCDLNQIVTNLVPYPIIHYPLANYAPIMSSSRAEHQELSTNEITRALFEPFCQMVRCNVTTGRYMACCLQYRGQVSPKQVNDAVNEIKSRSDIQFVDWCPTGFKLSISCQPPVSVPRSELANTIRNVCMLGNSTAITQVFNEMNRKFDVLFAKRAFVHWYVQEGLEEGEFLEVREQISILERDFEDIVGPDEYGDDQMYEGITQFNKSDELVGAENAEEEEEGNENDNNANCVTETSVEFEDIF